MRIPLAFLPLLACTAPLSAEITLGGAAAEVSLNGTVSQAPYSVPIAETRSSSVDVSHADTLDLQDHNGASTEGIDVTCIFAFENTQGIFANVGNDLRIDANGASSFSLAAVDLDANALPGSAVALDHRNENYREFTLDERTPCNLFGSISSDGLTVEVFLENKQEDDSWLPIRQAADEDFFLYAMLPPGTYRYRALIHGSLTANNTELSGSYTYTLITGSFINGNHTHPDFGTDFTDSQKLIVVTPAILSETDQLDGTTEVVITASVQNTSPCPWDSVGLRVPRNFPGGPSIDLLNPGITFDAIPPESTVAPDPGDTIRVLVPTPDLPAFRDSILDASRFTTTGRELVVFLFPLQPLGDPNSWEFNLEGEMVFGSGFDTVPGALLIESPKNGGIDPVEVEVPPLKFLFQGLDRNLPYLVSSVKVVLDGSAQPPTSVGGYQMLLPDLIRHGSLRSTVEPKTSNGLELTEGERGEVVPRREPIHFNRIPIEAGLEVSGSFLFSPGEFGVELEVEDLTLKRFAVTAAFKAEATLLVEAEANINNTNNDLNAKQKDILDFDVFSIVLPSGFRLTPEFTLSAGASVDAPSRVTIPFNSSLELIFTAGIENGLPFYDSEVIPIPLQTSGPALHKQVNVTAETWITAQLKCKIGEPSGTVETGPTFGTRIGGTATLAPLANPWWELDGNLKLLAGLELDLLKFIEIFDAEKVIHTEPLFHLDSDGPLVPPLKSLALPHNPGLRPLAGRDTRWARALRVRTDTANADTDVFVTPLEGTDDFIAGGGTIFHGEIGRYAPDGELLWLLDCFQDPFVSAVAEPDGGFTALGKGTAEIRLSRFDGDGNVLWAIKDNFPFPLAHDAREVVRGEDASGNAEYYVLSRHQDGIRLPTIVKYDQNGARLWAKHYVPDPSGGENAACEVRDCLITKDGNLVFVGETEADIMSGIGLVTTNITKNGLLVKIDSASGEVLWSKLIAHERIPEYHAIAEDPFGFLYLGGTHKTTVLDDLPSMLVTKLKANGDLIESVLIGHETGAEDPLGLGVGTLLTPLPHDGSTPFDIIHDLAWIDGALWIAGKMGIFNSSLSYTTGTSAFTARLTPALGVTRFVLHAGPHYDQIGAIADGGDGLLAVGRTQSFLPWPAGAASHFDSTPSARLVMKLPWEGALRFHELTAGAQDAPDDPAPDAGAYYNYPITAGSRLLPTFALGQTGQDGETTQTFFDTLPFTVNDLAPNPETTPAPPAFVTPLAYHALESAPADAIDSYADFLDWNQLDPDGDIDGDGLCGSAEFFFGTDPFTPDAEGAAWSVEPDMNGVPALTFQRSLLAGAEGWESPLQTSLDLEIWLNLPNNMLDSAPLTPGQDLEKLFYSPFYSPVEPQRFYRLVKPVAP